MKRLIIGILCSALAFALFYFLGAFAQASFDISKWSADARIIVAVFGGFLSLLTLLMTIMNDYF